MGPQCRGTFGRSEVERFFFGRTNKRSHPSIGPLSSTGDCAVTTLVERLCRFAVWGDSIKRVRRTRARQLIDGASFGPEALKVIGQAFENGWPRYAATSAMIQTTSIGQATVWRMPC